MKIDLQAWCDERYPRDQPWHGGERVYATDHYAILDVPAVDYPEVTAVRARPLDGFAFIEKRWPPSPTWAAMPPVLPDTMQTCPDCEGAKFVEMDCPDCDGRGRVTCEECGEKHKCDRCNGSGSVLSEEPCPACAGAGEVLRPTDQEICGVLIRGRHVSRLAALPGARVCRAENTNEWRILAFEFDGGRGMVIGQEEE